MNTYKIDIGKYTRKNVYQSYNVIFVNSENNINDIRGAYEQKYSGFTVMVNKIEEIAVFNKEIEEKKNEESSSSIKLNSGEYGDGAYNCRIKYSDIKDWGLLKARREDISRLESSLFEDFKKSLMEQFHLTRIENLKVMHDEVTFKFFPSWFNFKKTK